MGRIALRFFTRKDGWIHALPGIGAKWTQSRDLRGLPEHTFHEWWANRKTASQQVSGSASQRVGDATGDPKLSPVSDEKGTATSREER
jgi:hypothetical protein